MTRPTYSRCWLFCVCLFVVAFVSGSDLLAQTVAVQAGCSGGGGTAGTSYPSTAVGLLHERCGGQDRLAAVVIWREANADQPWGRIDSEVDAYRSRIEQLQSETTDSGALLSGGWSSDGPIRITQWFTKDRRLRIFAGEPESDLDLLAEYDLALSDSVLVVLVDLSSGGNARPRVVGVRRISPRTTEGLTPNDEQLLRLLEGDDAARPNSAENLRRFLAEWPEAAAYLPPPGSGKDTRDVSLGGGPTEESGARDDSTAPPNGDLQLTR